MSTESEWHLVDALELDFDGRAKLRLGKKSAVEDWDSQKRATVALRLKGHRWWIERSSAIDAFEGLPTSSIPPSDVVFFPGVLVRVRPSTFDPMGRKGVELSLPQTIELFLCEGKGRSGDSHRAKWVDEPVSETAYSHPHLGTDKHRNTVRISTVRISEGAAGDVWLRVGRGVVPIAILPRHLLGAEPSGLLSDRVSGAVRLLSGLILELWSLHGSCSSRPPRGTESKGGSITLTTDESGEKPDWSQRLARLDHLIFRSGVEEAWAAMVADPFVRLSSRYPAKPIHRARRPILAGPRGPWSLDDGWSPYNQSGLVRDRKVVRTVDTPPNRLAVGLASRVLDELGRIEAEAGSKLLSSSLGLVADELRHAAESVLHAPVFADIPRDAKVPLDSPSLQLNARCRPLLDAWSRLGRRMALRGSMYSEVLSEPIARAEVLYERWCHAAMIRAAQEIILEKGRSVEPEYLLVDGTFVKLQSSDCVVFLYYTGTLPTELSKSGESDEPWNWDGLKWSTEDARQRHSSPSGGDLTQLDITSWSPVSRPDGVLVVVRPGRPTTAHCWDAKYRPITMPDGGRKPDREAAGAAYQAHAFRDAVNISFSSKGREAKATAESLSIAWSLVIHPGALRPNKDGRPSKNRMPLSCSWYRTDSCPEDGGVEVRFAGPAKYADDEPRARVFITPPKGSLPDLRRFMEKVVGA